MEWNEKIGDGESQQKNKESKEGEKEKKTLSATVQLVNLKQLCSCRNYSNGAFPNPHKFPIIVPISSRKI
jgi:hypothetical protein